LKLRAGAVLSLRSKTLIPAHLDFVGLWRAGQEHHVVPDAVILHDGQPFVYLLEVNGAALSTAQTHAVLRRLSLRADAPYAAFLRPGSVQVFSLGNVRDDAPPVLEAQALDPGVFARLVVGSIPLREARATSGGAHELMLSLLNAVTDRLVHSLALPPAEALALVGRALFMRFLIDRGLLRSLKSVLGIDDLRECFSTAAAAAATSRWLDATFNGDLLELPDRGSAAYFAALEGNPAGSALADLCAIMRGDQPVGDGVYQIPFRWSDLHFSYVPVGLLSQVYEAFAHRFDVSAAKQQSVYYTPRHLAEYTVDRALAMLGPQAHRARVLDPASGGGVFLLAAFRRLVRARWEATGQPPATADIRQILNEQLVGLDINPAARQLCALALYLTALELDPNTASLRNLKFRPLQGTVLIAAEGADPGDDTVALGSLSGSLGERMAGQFDLVCGNPPWTAVKDAPRRLAMADVVRRHAAARGIADAINPDGVPDLPFVWAATQFAKPGAVLAFALHGRLLTKVSEAGHGVRTQLFRGLDVSYVLNGMELRNTPVWPNMNAHFCLLFARNAPPGPGSAFHVVTPVQDRSLNREGRIRIDSKDAWTSDLTMVASTPHLFKTLAKGNALDVELLERIAKLAFPTLGSYATALGLERGHGYQTEQRNIPGVPAGFLRRLPVLPKPPQATWLKVPVATLPKFELARVHRRREQPRYRAPLVLLRESPSVSAACPLAMLSLGDVAYSRSYIGFSCHGAPQSELLACYLVALFNSPLFLYFILMTSSKLGCERSTLQHEEAEQFPIRAFDDLTASQLTLLRQVRDALENDAPSARAAGKALVRDIYGLRPADVALIEDRLATGLPSRAVLNKAMAPPVAADLQRFQSVLAQALLPFDTSAQPAQVEVSPQSPTSPWRFLRIGAATAPMPAAPDLLAAIAVADLLDASQVELPYGDSLCLGILNQRRYWSRSAARTLAVDLVRRAHPVLSRPA
jgi:hypothetical protein